MFTVAAYALFFGVSYSSKTYISLVPLTVGVMLASFSDISASNFVGILAAFGSALVFVSQNIFFKKVVPSNGGSSPRLGSQKLDKLNLLLYCSSVGLALTIPLWLYYELGLFVSATTNPGHIKHPKSGHDTPHSLAYYIFLNGTVNFAQNIIAFVILGRTSPVTYSIASLIKRVAVICIAIVWFNQAVNPVQGLGILMTFTGLYMYNNAKGDVEKGEKKMRRVAADRGLMLPTTVSESRVTVGSEKAPRFETSVVGSTGAMGPGSAYPRSASSMTSHTLHHPYSIPQPHPFPTHHLQPSILPVNMKQPPKNLNIRITSPIASYPSPPSSVGSPPSEPVALDDFNLYETHQERQRPAVVAY
jgi:solute carrier family 35 protein E1